MGCAASRATHIYCHAPPVAAAFCCSLLCRRGLLVFSVVGSLVGSGSGPAVLRLGSQAPGFFSHMRFFIRGLSRSSSGSVQHVSPLRTPSEGIINKAPSSCWVLQSRAPTREVLGRISSDHALLLNAEPIASKARATSYPIVL